MNVFLLMFAVLGCKSPPTDMGDLETRRPRTDGDPAEGWNYLIYGDYVGAGVPAEVWFDLLGESSSNVLGRTGDAARVPSAFNLFEAENGVPVVGGLTCVGCHGGTLRGEFVPGLGGVGDFSSDSSNTFELAGLAVDDRYGRDSPEWDAFYPLLRGSRAIAPHILAPMAGVNPAFSMERAAVAFRNPETLEWVSDGQPVFEIPEQVLASDVPPWWNTKKKSRLYYTGAGQGDRATLISQISVVALTDAPQFEAIADRMVDAVAWLDTLEAPVYPGSIDPSLAAEGQDVFAANCESCHGTYDADPALETYPDRVIPLDDVGTDPVYAEGFLEPGFTDWLQRSHLATAEYPAVFEPTAGYVAPPLDGIWASAPYLHNGSVPDLPSLLDSTTRPTAWQRTALDIDLDAMGVYWSEVDVSETPPGAADPGVYDTRLPSFGSGGHTFGDVLEPAERRSLLEYLKTL